MVLRSNLDKSSKIGYTTNFKIRKHTMALAYLLIGAANTDTAFCTRVVAALENAASAIQNESAGAANHIQRVALVGRVLSNPVTYSQQFALAIASIAPVLNAASLAAALDTDIQTGVNSVWDMFATRGI